MDPNWTRVWSWRYGLLQGLALKRNSVGLGLKEFATGTNSPLPRADRLFMWWNHRHRRLCFTIQRSVVYFRYRGAHTSVYEFHWAGKRPNRKLKP